MFRFTKSAQAPPTSANTAIPPSRAARLDRDLLTCQKLVLGKTYPVPFILTSNKDDRVHPAHGRKAAARLAALASPISAMKISTAGIAAANLTRYARRLALEYTYASRRLVD